MFDWIDRIDFVYVTLFSESVLLRILLILANEAVSVLKFCQRREECRRVFNCLQSDYLFYAITETGYDLFQHNLLAID